MKTGKTATQIIFNAVIVVLAVIGIILMLTRASEDGSLQASGIENFKFYTVLSNVFCGLVALIQLVFTALNKDTTKLIPLKLGAVCATTITFVIVAFFFGPLYGWIQFYQGGNLYFHLLEPIVAIIEFLAVRRNSIPFRYAVFAAIPTFLYGIGYTLNILINGIGGPWPDSNDFYAFLSWGWTAGIIIFISITLIAFGLACLFRKLSNRQSLTD
jgi:hypothetical protein